MLLLAALKHLAADVEVDGVRLLCAFNSFLERECEDLGMVTEPPKICFSTSQASTVNAGLLTGSDSDDGAVVGIGHTVGLGVLESEGGDNQIRDGLLRKLWVVVSGYVRPT